MRNIDTLEYHLIRGKLVDDDLARADLYNRAYVFWKEFWSDVFKKNGAEHRPNPDDLLRQDWVGVFEHRECPIALHAHSVFDLRQLATKEHSYFTRYFTEKALRALRDRGANKVVSLECYSVSPEWRSAQLGVSLAEVMIGIGLKIAKEAGADAAIGVARCDVGVDRMTHNQGAVALDTGLVVHNTPVELIACFPDLVRPHEDPRVNALIEHFWRHRRGPAGTLQPVPLKIAA